MDVTTKRGLECVRARCWGYCWFNKQGDTMGKVHLWEPQGWGIWLQLPHENHSKYLTGSNLCLTVEAWMKRELFSCSTFLALFTLLQQVLPMLRTVVAVQKLRKREKNNPTQEQTNSPVPPHTVWTYLFSKEQYRRRRRTPSLCDAREKPSLLALSRKYRTHRVGHGLLKRTEQSLVPVNKTPKRVVMHLPQKKHWPRQYSLHSHSMLQTGRKARVPATEDSFRSGPCVSSTQGG